MYLMTENGHYDRNM